MNRPNRSDTSDNKPGGGSGVVNVTEIVANSRAGVSRHLRAASSHPSSALDADVLKNGATRSGDTLLLSNAHNHPIGRSVRPAISSQRTGVCRGEVLFTCSA